MSLFSESACEHTPVESRHTRLARQARRGQKHVVLAHTERAGLVVSANHHQQRPYEIRGDQIRSERSLVGTTVFTFSLDLFSFVDWSKTECELNIFRHIQQPRFDPLFSSSSHASAHLTTAHCSIPGAKCHCQSESAGGRRGTRACATPCATRPCRHR